MIQSIKRAFRVLELLAAHEPLTLKALAARTGLKKPTLCVMLKTLTALGYAARTEQGMYALGDRFVSVAFSARRKGAVSAVARGGVEWVAKTLGEGAVAAVARGGERYTVARATGWQSVVVQTHLFEGSSFYQNATGRVLLAYMSEAERAAVVKHAGLPGAVWEEAATEDDLERACLGIRREGLAVMATNDWQAWFVAAPVFGPDGKVWMALGVNVPAARFGEEHQREVTDTLRRAAERAGGELAVMTDRAAVGGGASSQGAAPGGRASSQ